MWILKAGGHGIKIIFQGFTWLSGEKKQLEEKHKMSMLIQQRHPVDVEIGNSLSKFIPNTCLVV